MNKLLVILAFSSILLFLIFIKSLLELKPRKFKGVEIIELKNFMYLLLYRGLTDSYSPNGMLYISSYRGLRKIMLRKYNHRNKVGLYLYFPIYNDSIRLKVEEVFFKYGKDKKMWIDKIPEIREKVVGVNIYHDIEFGYNMICWLLKYVYLNSGAVSFIEEVYFTNVDDSPDKFIDFEIEDIKNYDDLVEYINMPLTLKGKIVNIFSWNSG